MYVFLGYAGTIDLLCCWGWDGGILGLNFSRLWSRD